MEARPESPVIPLKLKQKASTEAMDLNDQSES
jgi:hypothetical protein